MSFQLADFHFPAFLILHEVTFLNQQLAVHDSNSIQYCLSLIQIRQGCSASGESSTSSSQEIAAETKSIDAAPKIENKIKRRSRQFVNPWNPNEVKSLIKLRLKSHNLHPCHSFSFDKKGCNVMRLWVSVAPGGHPNSQHISVSYRSPLRSVAFGFYTLIQSNIT